MITQQTHEQEIMRSYDKYLWKIVHTFMRRCRVRTVTAEDLMQEARMAFLQHIRTHMPEEYHLCRLTIWHALCDAVVRAHIVKMPNSVFFNQERKIQHWQEKPNELLFFPTDDGGFDAASLVAQIMEAVEKFPAEAMELVKLKMEGYSNREAAQVLGMTDVQVSRTLKRIRRMLDDDAA